MRSAVKMRWIYTERMLQGRCVDACKRDEGWSHRWLLPEISGREIGCCAHQSPHACYPLARSGLHSVSTTSRNNVVRQRQEARACLSRGLPIIQTSDHSCEPMQCQRGRMRGLRLFSIWWCGGCSAVWCDGLPGYFWIQLLPHGCSADAQDGTRINYTGAPRDRKDN
jgi:hypothetical protein